MLLQTPEQPRQSPGHRALQHGDVARAERDINPEVACRGQ